MSIEGQVTHSDEFRDQLTETFERLCSSNPAFEHAYDTYIQQYGKDVVTFNDPINIADTIDPIVFVFGRNTAIKYFESSRTLSGSLGSQILTKGSNYIIGRRQPQDSRLVIWSPGNNESELEAYNPQSSTIPSRIHGAILFQDDRHILFTDLGSSSGTVIIGEWRHQGTFVKVYDPGSAEFPRIKFVRTYTLRKD
jgi:hypothetical protein